MTARWRTAAVAIVFGLAPAAQGGAAEVVVNNQTQATCSLEAPGFSVTVEAKSSVNADRGYDHKDGTELVVSCPDIGFQHTTSKCIKVDEKGQGINEFYVRPWLKRFVQCMSNKEPIGTR